MLLSVFKVRGHSMEPLIKEGSFLVASSIPFILRKPGVKDIVFFKSKDKIIVKRIVREENMNYFVEGDNNSDSQSFGPIPGKDIIGKVIARF